MRRHDWDGRAILEPGEYARSPEDGLWYVAAPGQPRGRMGCLGGHTVTEHADGTITVSPSILLTAGDGQRWHGYLVAGEWRPCR